MAPIEVVGAQQFATANASQTSSVEKRGAFMGIASLQPARGDPEERKQHKRKSDGPVHDREAHAPQCTSKRSLPQR
jgi:hypothetical protein